MTAHWAPWLLLNTAAVTVILATGYGLSLLLRNRKASVRRAIWRSTFFSVFALLACSALMRALPTAPTTIFTIRFTTTSATFGNAPAAHQIDLFSALLVLWGIGTAIYALRLVIAHLLVWNAARRGRRDHDGAIVSPAITAPAAWGIVRADVILPADSKHWDETRRDIVIAHEKVHVGEKDCSWHFLAQLATALYWFHPLAWIGLKKLQEEAEFHCDEVLIARGIAPSAYAETLLAFAAAPSRFDRLCPVTVAVARRTSVGRRIQRVLTMNRTSKLAGSGAALALLPCLLILPLAVMQAAPDQNKQESKQEAVKVAPVIISKVNPTYTQEAKDAKIQGKVVLMVTISAQGEVSDVQLVTGIDDGLDRSAMDAVRQWKFKPATVNGQPVEAKSHIEVNFTLRD